MSQTNELLIEFARKTIAIAKDEVEGVIGTAIIPTLDRGSPWGRAFIRVCNELDELEENDEWT